MADTDLFWQMRVAAFVVEHARVPSQALHTSLATDPAMLWNDWLGALAYYAAYSFGSFAGVVVLRMVAVGALATLSIFLGRKSGASFAFACLVTSLALATMSFRLFTERPLLLAAIVESALLIVVVRVRLTYGRVLAATVMTIAWAQIHGSALLAPWIAVCVLLGHAAARAWPARFYVVSQGDGRSHPLVPAVALVISTTLALFITPLGTNIVRLYGRYFIETGAAGALSQRVTEWEPPSWDVLTTIVPAAGAGLVMIAAVIVWDASASRRSRAFGELLLPLVPALLFVRSIRFLPDLVMASAFVTGSAWQARNASSRAMLALVALVPVALLAFELGTDGLARPAFRERRAWYPHAAVQVLRNAPPGTIGNSFAFGGFLHFHLAPRQRPFVDGRLPAAYPVARLAQWHDARESPAMLERLATREHWTACVIAYPERRAPRTFSKDFWALVQLDDVSVTYVRRAAVSRAWLDAHELRTIDARSPFDSLTHWLEQGQSARVLEDLRRAERLTHERFLLLALRAHAAARTGDLHTAQELVARARHAFPGREGMMWSEIGAEQVLALVP